MTTDIKELVKRLRDGCVQHSVMGPVAMRDAADALEAMAGEVERLKDQNTAWADKYGDTQNAMYAALDERDRLKAALEPFAKLSTDRERQDPPEGTMRVRVVTAPEIEAARKALGGDA